MTVDLRKPLSLAEEQGRVARDNEAAMTAYGMGRAALDIISQSTNYEVTGDIYYGGQYFSNVEKMSMRSGSNLIQMGRQNGGR